MVIDDIDGSRPTVKKEFAPRDTLNCFDVPGAQAKKPYMRTKTGTTHFDNLQYTDVTKPLW